MKLTPTETKEVALELGIPVLTPLTITSEVVAELTTYGADHALVVAYGKILPQKLLDIFPLGVLNIHYSLLPKYRGASPVESALRAGDTSTGVAIQKMVYELDAGDLLVVQETKIEPTETTRELRPRLVALGAELLVTILPSFLDGTAILTPQDPTLVTRCGKIAKEEGELTLSRDALKNWNTYRAFAESPGTYFFVEKNGKCMRVKIKTAMFDGSIFTPVRVVPEGKQEMAYTDFIQ